MKQRVRVGFSLLLICATVSGLIPLSFAETLPPDAALSETVGDASGTTTEAVIVSGTEDGEVVEQDPPTSETGTTTTEAPVEDTVLSPPTALPETDRVDGADVTDLPDVGAGTDAGEVRAEGALQALSSLLADYFIEKSEHEDIFITEVIPVYELDQPIIIPVTPQKAVLIEEESETFIEKVVDEVRDWFGGDTGDTSGDGDVMQDPPVTQEEISAPVDTLTPSEVPEDTDASQEETTSDATPEEQESTDASRNDAPVSLERDTMCDWWQFWCRVYVYAEESEPFVDAQAELPIESPSQDIESTPIKEVTPPALETGATSASSTQAVENALEEVSLNQDEAESPANVPSTATSTASTTYVIIEPLVSLGTTSIPAEIVQIDTGEYRVVIPPGGLPLGIHELIVATSTAHGEVRERVVVDYGGGFIEHVHLDTYGTLLITENEAGEFALWLWQGGEGGASVRNLVPFGAYTQGAPLGLFDDVVFYLSRDGESLHGYDLVSGGSFSLTIEEGRRATQVALRSGAYYVVPNDIDFQFVSVVDTVY